MSDVTEADREKAREIRQSHLTLAETPHGLEESIAAALAEEREKARAPFLRLASEFGSWPAARILSPHDAGDRIRRAAQESE